MKNRPGISWGQDAPVNAMRTSRGWLLVDFSRKRPRIVAAVSKRLGVMTLSTVLEFGHVLNYGAGPLDPAVRAEMDLTT